MNFPFVSFARRLAIAGFVLLAALPSAFAQTYGNIARSFTPGKVSVGAALSQTKRDFSFEVTAHTDLGTAKVDDTLTLEPARQMLTLDYGISEKFGVGAQVGTLTLEDEDGDKLAGTEYAALLWHQLKHGDSGVSVGFMAGLRSASLSNEWESGPYRQTDIGIGISKAAADKAVVYADIIYSKVTGELKASSKTIAATEAALSAELGTPVSISSLKGELQESSAVLLALGTEIQAGSGTVTLELHGGAETGFALGFQIGL